MMLWLRAIFRKENELRIAIYTYLNNEKQTTGELRIVNSETGLDMADLEARYDAPTEKLTIKTKYTSQSFYPYELKAEHIYAEDNPDSLQDAINVLNGVVDYFYPEGNGVYVDQVEVRSRARKVKGIDDYKLGECVEGYPMGTYRLSVRPKIEGVPIYIEISRRTRINQFESDDAYFKIWKKAERIMAINDMWFEYMNCNSFEFSGVWLKKKNIFAEDVPLVSLETVLSVLEDKIKSGNIRNVYALELGYCAYASEEEIGFSKPDRSDAAKIQLCNRLEADEKMISYLDGTCRMEIEPIRKTEQLEEDVPLCSFDKVQSTVEKLIQNGYIRRVYALRFGYCCYRDVEGGNVLYPVWQIECDYAFDPAKQLSPDESYPVMERMHYSTMIVNAQTGEFMNPVKLKDKLLDAPKVTSWKDVR